MLDVNLVILSASIETHMSKSSSSSVVAISLHCISIFMLGNGFTLDRVQVDSPPRWALGSVRTTFEMGGKVDCGMGRSFPMCRGARSRRIREINDRRWRMRSLSDDFPVDQIHPGQSPIRPYDAFELHHLFPVARPSHSLLPSHVAYNVGIRSIPP
jgi:hypothetical protein